jgi:hypothetical protein
MLQGIGNLPAMGSSMPTSLGGVVGTKVPEDTARVVLSFCATLSP